MQGFVRSAALLAALVGFIPVMPEAQALSPRGCTDAIARISAQAGQYGARVDLKDGIRWSQVTRRDNPTNRTQEVMVVFSQKSTGFQPDALMGGAHLQTWANTLSGLCSKAAVVSFGIAQSDHIVEFALDKNGVPVLRRCVAPEHKNPSWEETPCL